MRGSASFACMQGGWRGTVVNAKIYGSTYRKGTRTEHFSKVSGGLIRHICQQLEKAGIVELYGKGGRVITSAGMRDLDLIAGRCPSATPMTFT